MKNYLTIGNFRRRSLYSFKTIAALFVLLIVCLTADAQMTLNTAFNAGVTDGNSIGVVTAVQADGKILVGGNFAFANGTEKFGLVRLNSDGSLDNTFNVGGLGPNGIVYEIKVLGDGKIIIGGGFGTYNGTTIQGLARLNSNGTLDTTFNVGGVGVLGGVQGISIQSDGKYVLTGGISAYNGTAKFSVIRVNTDGTLDTGFTSPFAGQVFVEQSGLQTDGKIIIGGQFTTGAYSNFARLTTTGSLDTTFNGGGSGSNGAIFQTHVLADNKILLGGPFSLISGTARPGLARLNADGTVDAAFTPAPTDFYSPEYVAVKPNGQYVYAGDLSNNAGDYPIALINSDGSLDGTFARPQADNIGYHVTLQSDGKILMAGYFNNVEVLGGLTHRNLVRLNANGTVDTTFVSPFSSFGGVQAMLQQPDGKFVVAGNFNSANGVTHRNIARFNADGTIDASFDSGYGIWGKGNVRADAVAVQTDGKILLGGTFLEYNLNGARGLARLNANGTFDATFNPIGISAGNPAVNDLLVLPDGKILVGGTGLDIAIQNLLRLNPDGSGDTSWPNGNGNGGVQKILRQTDGKIIAVGGFTSYLGQSRNRIVRLNADGTLDGTFNLGTGANNQIFAAELQPNGKILIGGGFTTYNGTTRNRIARLNSDGTLDTTFNPVSGANAPVTSIVVLPDGKFVIGGNFTTYDGSARIRLAKVNADGTLDPTADSGIENNFRFGTRRLLRAADGEVLVGGSFVNYGGVSRNSLAKLKFTKAATVFDFDGDAKTDLSIFRPNGPNGAEWWWSRSSNGGNGAVQFGSPTDTIAAADYTGDGKTDVAFWRPSTGQWYVLRSDDFSFYAFPFGTTGDVPVPADYDGDGKADAAVYRPSALTWYISRSTGGTDIVGFGASGDKPITADYDGDGKADISVFRPNGANGAEWWIRRSGNLSVFATQFGSATDKAVPADYTGDGKADVAFWIPSSGQWFILRSEDLTYYAFPFGSSTDTPSPGDYDGDGKTDAAVFRPSNSTWYAQRSTAGLLIQQFGATGDVPLPNAYVR